MFGLGIALILFSIGSAILPMMGRQFVLLSWIDNWGTTVGWVIRAVMIAIGLVLIAVARKQSSSGGGS